MPALISDLTHLLTSTFAGGDFVDIATICLISLIAAFSIRNVQQAFGWSVIAMLLLAALNIIYSVGTGPLPGEFSSWMQQLHIGWNQVMAEKYRFGVN